MKKIASATLARLSSPDRRSTVEVVELDLPGGDAVAARCIVTVRQDLAETSLTASPMAQDDALRRAVDFIRRRMAAGDVLVRQEGFDALAGTAATTETSATAGTSATAAAAVATEPVAITPDAIPGRTTASATSAEHAVPGAIQALVARFQPDRWKLLPPSRRSRSAWRVAECADTGHPASPTHQALRGLVPRLIDLLDSGEDLLDLCLAAAIGRLGDPGAAEAMKALSTHGRSPATQRYARQAWLMLDADGRAAEADRLRQVWAEALALEASGEARILALEAWMTPRRLSWPALLQDWYDLALADPSVRPPLLDVLHHLPLVGVCFQGIRYVYKTAELRRDAGMVALLHARFEASRANPAGFGRMNFLSPTTGERMFKPPRQRSREPDTFSRATRRYLIQRGLRQLRRQSALQHPSAIELAVQLLLTLDDRTLPAATSENRYSWVNRQMVTTQRFYPPGAHWRLVSDLLLPRLTPAGGKPGSLRFWSREPLDLTRALPHRTEALQPMWDAHPEALLRLALNSRSALVQAVVARALQDHAPMVQRQPAAVLQGLLRSPYAPAVETGFAAAKARVLASPPQDQVEWLQLMAASSHAPAQDFALMHIGMDPATFSRFPVLIVALLLSGQPRARKQGQGLALLAPSLGLLEELLAALAAVDADTPELPQAGAALEALLAGPLGDLAAEHLLPMLSLLLPLLEHGQSPVVSVAVTWLLRHPVGLSALPPATLTRLLASDDDRRRACGARLLAALSDDVLRGQVEMIAALATSGADGIRAAIEPALVRVSQEDEAFARTLADRLHASLFQTESGTGAHADALRWLTGPLQAVAPARDPSGTWRALQARSTGAQRYGAWALGARVAADFSLRQWATLARHADVQVRQAAMQAMDTLLPATPAPEQVDDLLPLAETGFEDTKAYTRALIGERLPDASLSIDLLIGLVDHPSLWVQSLGRARMVRRMSAADAALCLTRLSQHPGPQVQLFVTQWLLELPTDDPVALAGRLRGLTPYFLAVLSQVHRGRTAKTRVIDFLRAQTIAPETAEVVAAIFARQVVTASLTDKPQYIAGLRDIAARHPGVALPFLQWKSPAAPSHPSA